MMDQPVVTTVLYVNGDVPSAAASPVASWSAAVTAEPSSSASWKMVIVYSIAVAMVGSATLTPESERKKKKEKTPPFEFLPEETVPSLSGQMIVFHQKLAHHRNNVFTHRAIPRVAPRKEAVPCQSCLP
jgi:hypothetical protein